MILISAGHFPERPGVCFGSFCEHGEACTWAINIVENLISLGQDAELVPSGVLKEKIEFINSINPLFAVEIHFNSYNILSDVDLVGGSRSLYLPGSEIGALLASNIQIELAKAFKPDLGICEGWYRGNTKRGADYFLDKTECTSVIIEPEFIHRKATIERNRSEACLNISKAILKTKSEL